MEKGGGEGEGSGPPREDGSGGGGEGSGPPREDGSGGGGGSGSGGGGDRGRDRDRISGLPDDACHRIMSFLKAWDALRTSELSRRWRNMWSTAPRLDIRHPCSCADVNADEGRHRRFVKDLLLRRRDGRAPLDTLRMCWSHGGEANTWVAYAVRHEARVIELSAKNHRLKPEPEYTSFISDGFDKLNILKLTSVKLDSRIIRQLCSSFQELELKNCHMTGAVVQSTSLKRFTMINCFTHKVLSVDAPNLALLRCIRPYGDVPEIKNSESLVTVTIMLDDSRLRCDPGDMPPPDDEEDVDESDDEAEKSDGINYDESDPRYDDNDEYYDPGFQGFVDKKPVEPEEYEDRTVAYGEIAYESSSTDGDGYGGWSSDYPICTGHGTLDSLSNVRTMDLLAHSGEIVLRRELKNKCPMFSNLKTLSLGDWCIAPEFVLLSIILEHSPNLESLFLHLDMDYVRRVIIDPSGRSVACSNLKMVKITCSKYDTMVHKLAKFFRDNGVPLKKIWVRRIAGKSLMAKRKAHGKATRSSAKQRKV